MTAGKLASAKPGATTDTLLYRCPISKATSGVINVTNQSAGNVSYRVGLRDYDQALTLDSSNYAFRRGNVVTKYQLELTPGVQITSLTPGSLIELNNQNATFKYFDYFTPTDTIEIPVQVASVGSADYGNLAGGYFAVGDTLTGTNGLTATVYFDDATSVFKLSISDITNSDTTFRVSGDGTNISASDLLNVDNELVTVSSLTGNQVTVTRASSSTTAAAHTAGSVVTIVRPTVDTTTLAADITDTAATSFDVADASALFVGNYLRLNDEFMLLETIDTNTLTVSRGQLGTTATTHTNGDTVTRHTNEGYVALQYFDDGEQVNNGSGVTADIAYAFGLPSQSFAPINRFVFDLENNGSFSLPDTLSLDLGRTYRYTQDDASNTGELLTFTDDQGTAYSTTVTINGTPGSAGAYTEIDVTEDVPTILFVIGVADGIGIAATVNSSPLYTTIYVYDVEGTIASTDSFETTTGTNTVVSVTGGPYGYVQLAQGSVIGVSLGLNSVPFAGTDTFYDSPREDASTRSIATVSSVSTYTDINAEDYLFYDKTLAANTTDKNSGIIIGPGQSLVVYSSTADINYVLNGFEDDTNDYDVNLYLKVAAVGGAGGGGIITP